MHFMSTAKGWHCQFLEEDLKTPLRRRLTFQDPSKIEEMAEKGGAVRTSEGTQIMEYALKQGRGSVWLNLTEEQYRKLK
ncbi:hypothetical protein AciX9_2009 [Granulicella tundricola MP5ACTX9]|uniref:Uncharacterized protein n=2 Tax=Granulicella TaxID=940557 RepID=E8X1A0_GRATM|nr:hypothetical protein AciX9_2009 [Granulicella tundricola MP5ACTX9]